MCNASTARSVVSPWSGRQMTSYLSQSEPRNTHLGLLSLSNCLGNHPLGTSTAVQLCPKRNEGRREKEPPTPPPGRWEG